MGGDERVTTPDGVVIEVRRAPASTWADLASDWVTTGLWPVILVPSRQVADWRERILEDILELGHPPLTEVLAEAQRIDTDRLIQRWLEDSTDPDDDEDEALDERFPASPVAPPHSNVPNGDVQIALVPCAEPAEVLGVLKFGGWNSCPYPAEHVATMRRWAERYGARIYALGTDTLELLVSRPPTDTGAAVVAARELFAYDDDLVRQGVDTVGALASSLLDSPRWWFWWD